MSLRSFAFLNWTPVAVADAANMTASGFMAIQGAAATQRSYISEVQNSGMAGTSAPTPLTLARDSTIGVTPTALVAGTTSDGFLDPSASALAAPAVSFVASSTLPQRSNSVSLGRLSLGINASGSLFRWIAAPGEEYVIVGNTASLGEASLSAFTGGTPGQLATHIIYETK